MAGASRLQHDTLDQIIAKALEACETRSGGMGEEAQPIGDLYTPEGCRIVRTNAVRDALLAEGRIHAPDENSVTQWQPFLAIPLLVGAGCGNAKKDTP